MEPVFINLERGPYICPSQELYIGKDVCIKTHKRKGKLVDPGDLVSEKSLSRVYKILGKVVAPVFTGYL